MIMFITWHHRDHQIAGELRNASLLDIRDEENIAT
jgi:hypothetical protein